MPEEKHSTGTQKRDDLMTVALSLLMMPSPRSITSLPADRHLAGAPFRALAKLLEVWHLPRLGVNPRNETIAMLRLLFRIPVANG